MPTYGSNVLTGGTASASTDRGGTTYAAAKAVDANETTRWATDDNAQVSFWKYDLGVGVTKTVQKLGFVLKSTEATKYFEIDGSDDNATWRHLYDATGANDQNWQYYTFDNITAYRYYRISIFSIWAGTVASFSEIEMYERTGELGPGLTPLIFSAVTASDDRGGFYPISKSWDSDPGTRWATNDGVTSAWWKADLGTAAVATLLEFLTMAAEIPHAFTFEGSNNDSTWDSLLSTNGANVQTWQPFAITNATAYRYYRMSIASVYAGNVVSLSWVQLWGPSESPPAAGGLGFQAIIVS